MVGVLEETVPIATDRAVGKQELDIYFPRLEGKEVQINAAW